MIPVIRCGIFTILEVRNREFDGDRFEVYLVNRIYRFNRTYHCISLQDSDNVLLEVLNVTVVKQSYYNY